MMTKTGQAAKRDSTLLKIRRTRVMGVVNVTPDSFSDGGRYADPAAAAERALKMAEDGADIVDIGGESSLPGSKPISADEELSRVIPVINALKNTLDIPFSVDTYKSEVAREVLSRGASFINDITALSGDGKMAEVIGRFKAGVILMHMKGMPADMQDDPRYGDVVEEIISYLAGAIKIAERSGIDPDRIMVDPGIGFGKTLAHNLAILRDLAKLKTLGKPLLVGTSRKSFIGALTERGVHEREFGTAASVAVSVLNGADMVRVHDVAAMRDVVRVIDAITEEGRP